MYFIYLYNIDFDSGLKVRETRILNEMQLYTCSVVSAISFRCYKGFVVQSQQNFRLYTQSFKLKLEKLTV